MINTKAKWRKLFSREGVDAATLVEIDKSFYRLIRELAEKSKGEVFFSELKNKVFTHYSTFDFWAVGQPCYEKYLDSKEQIIKLYKRGKELIKENQAVIREEKKYLGQRLSAKKLVKALLKFSLAYEEVNFYYSIMPFWAIEYWQKAFNEILVKLVKRAGLAEEINLLTSSILKPWKKTALVKLAEKIASGRSAERLAKEYQFLRSWSFIWFEPISRQWINSLKTGTVKEKPARLFNQKEILFKLQPNAKEKRFITITPYIVFFKDYIEMICADCTLLSGRFYLSKSLTI